jgi:hypothetical protein
MHEEIVPVSDDFKKLSQLSGVGSKMQASA